MGKFARLFETSVGQVLLEKVSPNQMDPLDVASIMDENKELTKVWGLRMRCEDVGEIEVTSMFSFGSEQDQNLAFEATTDQQAESAAKQMQEMVSSFQGTFDPPVDPAEVN